MTVRTKMTIAGTEVIDYKDLKIEKSIGNFNKSSNFRTTLDTPFGRHAKDFEIGNEIIISADQDAAPTTKIFVGILEKKVYRGIGTKQELEIRGRDYSARLQDVTVEPIVYTNSEISTIVTNIIDNEVDDITTNNVDVTGVTLSRIAFNHVSVFDAIKELAELSGFIFYVDEDKDLHFELPGITDSGITLDNTNIKLTVFNRTREKFANKIWVYGDRQLTTAPEEIFTQDSNLGSTFTLTYKPHNTEARDSVNGVLKGGIFQVIGPETVSGLNYLVNFHDREITFVSGTTIGYSSIPANGGSVVFNYERSIPIVKFGENHASISAFGPKEKVIVDKSIKDPQTAKSILEKELKDSNPRRRIECDVKGWFTFKIAQTVNLVLSDFDLDDTATGINEIIYRFNSESIQSENIITIKLDERINDIIDELVDVRNRLKKIEAFDADETDIITRLELSTGSILVVGSRWEVRTNQITGSLSHLYSTGFTPPFPFNLASGINEGFLAGSFTGSAVAFTSLSNTVSGGFVF